MTSILFVCLGNICRSPTAEFIMKALVREAGQEDQFTIASAATSRSQWGEPVYAPAALQLARHGISSKGKFAIPMTAADYDKYDLLIGMDTGNIRQMRRIVGDDPAGKIRLLLSFAGREAEIDDPWYTGDFETAYREILEGCEGLLRYLQDHQA